MLRTKWACGPAIAAAALALPTTALATDIATCNAAYEDADALVHAGGTKLLEGRDKLRVCARAPCKAWMVKECTKSLSEVEARIPTVVFAAKAGSGEDLVEVAVTSEDKVVVSRLDGRAVEMGPGERVFTFAHGDGRRVQVKAIIKEGEKAQRVAATFDSGKAAAASTALPASDAHASPVDAPSIARPAGFVLVGLGVVGLGVGVIFGLKAAGSKSDAKCNERQECEPTALSDARSSATVATIGFIGGAALVAGGVALVMFAPSGSRRSAGRLEVRPAIMRNEAGFVVGSRW